MKKQSLIGVLFHGIKRLPKEQVAPMNLMQEWLAMSEYIKTLNKVMDRQYVELLNKGSRSCILNR